jgi:hypothetical protein
MMSKHNNKGRPWFLGLNNEKVAYQNVFKYKEYKHLRLTQEILEFKQGC